MHAVVSCLLNLQLFGLSEIVMNLQETTVMFLYHFFVRIVGHIHESIVLLSLSNRISSSIQTLLDIISWRTYHNVRLYTPT